jgi:archaetidylinositol phosphate synthase
MSSIGSFLGRLGVTPNSLTVAGFAFAVLAGILYATQPSKPYFGAVAIIFSGVLDVLDGAVARATKRVSGAGSFNDSTLDRLSEITIFSGIAFGGFGISPGVVLLTLGFSLLVSYVRAKGESLAITMTGIGIGERAERLVILIIFSLVGYVWIGIYIILILAVFTFFQRYAYVTRAIGAKAKLQEG